MLAVIIAFVGGFLTLGVIEVLVVLHVFKRLRPRHRRPSSNRSSPALIETNAGTPFRLYLKGVVWIGAVPPSEIAKNANKFRSQRDKSVREPKTKKDGSNKDWPEIFPVQRHARLEDHILFLASDDGSEEHIDLRRCYIQTISGSTDVSRKWAKKYPIKLESKERELVLGSYTCVLYLNTGWEKETWCQVLRAASRWNENTDDWYIKVKREFQEYHFRLFERYPTLQRLNLNTVDYQVDRRERTGKIETVLSRRRQLWKKLTTKIPLKGNAQAQDDNMSQEKPSNLIIAAGSKQGLGSNSLSNVGMTETKDDFDSESSGRSDRAASVAGSSRIGKNGPSRPLKNLDEKMLPDMTNRVFDQGAMCWNILFMRLFFDAYHSSDLKSVCQRLIQKQFSKITTPSYIGAITCTDLDLGTSPPLIQGMRAFPLSLDEVWAFEADVEYTGGAFLTIETKLDVRDSLSQEKVVNQSLEPTLAGAAAADLLRKGLESIEDSVQPDRKILTQADSSELVGEFSSGSGGSKSSRSASRRAWMQSSKVAWKSMLSHVADQVSQVPLKLSIRVVSLKGKLKFRLKPPPSDRIWFGFSSMPDFDLVCEPSVGDHKINTSPMASFITSRIKMLVQEALVLPNSEGILVPWMISEKDDWLSQTDAPLPWSPMDMSEAATFVETQATARSKHDGGNSKAEQFDTKLPTDKQVLHVMDPTARTSLPESFFSALHSVSAESVIESYNPELERPLLGKVDSASDEDLERISSSSRAIQQLVLSSSDNELSFSSSKDVEVDEQKTNQGSKRAKMISLGKKAGKKIEEKKRHMFGKMREGFEKNEQVCTES